MAVCPTCNQEYSGMGTHWQMSDCPYPELSNFQYDVVTGILMGDGYINRQENAKPRLVVGNTNKEFLEHVNSVLSPYTTGVSLRRTSEDVASHFQETGFTEGVIEENCSDFYEVSTRTSPVFNTFSDWYRTGEKIFPDHIELSSDVLKYWFVCDGYSNQRGNSYYIGLQMANEIDRRDKIERFFEEGPGVEVSYWNTRREGEYSYCCAEFNVELSRELIDYMGDPVPGFGYKWPE